MITVSIMFLSSGCLLLTALNSMSTLNPIKMAFALMMYSSLIFSYAILMGGSSWLPILLLLLFMGGILMVFMIISSVMPNEPSLPLKLAALLVLMTWAVSSTTNSSMTWTSQMKWFMQSTHSFYLIIIVILGYFVSFILMLSNEKAMLRSTL